MFINTKTTSWAHDGAAIDPAVETFHRQLPDYNTTSLINLPDIAKELGVGHVVVKDESNRFGLPAFKILGASWAIYKAVATKCSIPLPCSLGNLGELARAQGITLVTCTEGNWGRATARMAKYLQIPATIFVPDFMDQATRYKISSEGAKVVVVQGDYDDSIQAARKCAETENGLLVMDVSWKGYEEIPQWVVEGYSTMLTETDRQLKELVGKPATHAIAAVGVGSWAQAVSMHYKSKNPPATVIAVEPEGAACLQRSLEAGEMVSVKTGDTIMNGLNCGTVSYTAWKVLQNGVDVCVAVQDSEVHKDTQRLHSLGLQCGPCGAATLTCLRELCRERKVGLNSDSVVVLFSTEKAREYKVPA